ncbi:DUF4236 domain-containing protein [Vibrio sp. 10N.261.49.A5]|uniref:DUF4236 domain-containing protein n=1 Tax=unclassified Vibrio TaxID=2614977 RepID=UPI003550B5D2
MGFKFRKRIKIAPGVHLNLSKSGVSTSIGKPGATVNIGNKGVKATLGVTGSGLSYSQTLTDGSTSGRMQRPTKSSSLLTKLLAFAVVACLVIAVMDDPNTEPTNYSIVEAKSLRVRSEPSLNSSIIDQLAFGNKVEVKRNQGGWSFVETKGIRGWVSSEYLSEPKP